MERDQQTYSIIGAAMTVHRELGSGFLEAVYQEALEVEFKHVGIPFAREVELPIHYRDTQLATCYRADFLCYESTIVELKAIEHMTYREESQLQDCCSTSEAEVSNASAWFELLICVNLCNLRANVF